MMKLTEHNQASPPIRRRARRRSESHPTHERWLVSYADFVTLLFAFFTALYAISSVDAQKLGTMVDSLQEAFESVSPGTRELGLNKDTAGHQAASTTATAPRATPRPGPGGAVGLGDLQARLAARLASQIAAKSVDLEMDRRGLVIAIREAGSFATGSADLSGEAQTLLGEIAQTLADVGNQVRVEGHTDDVPIHTARFTSNWELSTIRATNVISFLLGHAAIQPERMSAGGYAEFHPRVSNDSEVNRARNRRIDIVVLSPATRAAEEPGKLGQQ